MYKHYITLLLSFASISLYAANVPPSLLFKGKPIDSICFTEGAKGNSIDLNSCGFKANHFIVNNKDDYSFKEDGYIGSEWDNDYEEMHGFTYYKFHPANGNKYWIETISNYGGSGIFGGISLVERKDSHTLTHLHIRGGDRCHGGISDVEIIGNQLTFSRNITAYHLIELGDENGIPKLDQNDVDSCMACCNAQAIYTMNSEDSQPSLLRVEINSGHSGTSEGKHGACYNKLLKSHSDKHPTLSLEMLKNFAQEFRHTCLQAN